jgi:hypothetical protein
MQYSYPTSSNPCGKSEIRSEITTDSLKWIELLGSQTRISAAMVQMALAVGADLHRAAMAQHRMDEAQNLVVAAQNLGAAAQHLAAEVGTAQNLVMAAQNLGAAAQHLVASSSASWGLPSSLCPPSEEFGERRSKSRRLQDRIGQRLEIGSEMRPYMGGNW